MFIITFFLEYILLFILLVFTTIALLSEYKKIIVNNSLFLPTILMGLLLNFIFFDIIIDPFIGIRSSFLGLCAGFIVGIILKLFNIINKNNFYTFLSICSFLGIYRFFGFIVLLIAISGVYFFFNLLTHCKYLNRIRPICTNGFLICISAIFYCIIVLI